MAVTITRSAWVDDDGTGTTGTVINNAVKTSLYNEIDAALAKLTPVADVGLWVDVPFVAANFAAGAGTWTITPAQIDLNRYTRVGKIVTWTFYSRASALAGASSGFFYLLPPVPPSRGWANGAASRCFTGGAMIPCVLYLDSGSGFFVASVVPATFAIGSIDLGFTITYETN